MEKSSVLTLSQMQSKAAFMRAGKGGETAGNSGDPFLSHVSNPWFKLQEVLTLLYDDGRIRT